MSLHPTQTTQALEKSYLDYLSTTFRLRDGELQRQFEEGLRTSGKFVKGPILEATPPFETGRSLEELIQEGVLSPQFRKLKSKQLPLDRALYQHQETAIRKAVSDHRNLVVATGTGSGKTEAFLVPIFNHLFREKESGQLTPGVRALLLYPMNALANDQMARMCVLLQNYPHITFGRYTGETAEHQKEAEEKYRKMFRREPLRNELISRDQMRDSPPHILLTNYAMLEYLLLRPDDHVFFDGEYARSWRFLVIDEAHTYTGAKGIEMAILLRRLKDRVVASEPRRLQCMVTSATLGNGREDFPEIAQFAQRLFGEPLEWVDGDTTRQDVVEAVRKPMKEMGAMWGRPDPSLYRVWAQIIDESRSEDLVPELQREAEENGVPEGVLREANAKSGEQDYQRFLYEILRGDKRLVSLRDKLEQEPQYLEAAAYQIVGDVPDAENCLIALVDVASRAKPGEDDHSLIPARYHLFVRAIEGAYLSLRPRKRLYLERREVIEVDEKEHPVFEIAACRQCGSTYLVGETQNTGHEYVLKHPGKRYFEHADNMEFYLLLEKESSEIPFDEDETISYGDEIEVGSSDERYKLCAACGAIAPHNLFGTLCACDPANYCDILKVPSRRGNVYSCPACGRRSPSGLVWRFLTGRDAATSVLATALYQQIPTRPKLPGDVEERDVQNGKDYSSTKEPRLSGSAEVEPTGEGRQLLIFSDSRQAAAFFAPYLNRTYSQILQRRLILQTIETHREDVRANRWRIQDLITPLQRTAEELGLFGSMSIQEQKDQVWKWVLYELLAMDRRNSLEGLGCLGFSLVKPASWQAPRPLARPPWDLTDDEVWMLFQILLDSFRTKGALLFPDNVSPEDEFFRPRNREHYFRENQSSPKKHVLSWSSHQNRAMNARLDFLMRLQRNGLGVDIPEQECRDVLRKIWQQCLFPGNWSSCWQEYFSSLSLDREGTVYRMRYNFWELLPSTVDEDIKWYYCQRCNNLTVLNLRGVCPTYQCDGKLQECRPEEISRNNHYRNLYLGIAPIRMKAEEHTAQLTSAAAAELQTQFIRGEVNVLSCSTTFELGVDVGELESVFMRNVPPSSANYVQRAGRAGRRTDSTAFALTFAQRRSHDLTHFKEPKRMVSGVISAPHFELENEKIVRRHVYATALAQFWNQHSEMFRDVKSFFFAEGKVGPDLLREYLSGRPKDLQAALRRIVPDELHQALDLDDWGWVSGLFDESEGVLLKCAEEVRNDVQELEKAREELVRNHRPSDYILRAINTIKDRYLINLLSSRNVIPKYGFPVDVVELQILHHTDEAKKLELDRDLRIALSEYAPSSQVVAGGKLWTSRYLKRMPTREWPKYRYAICDYCQCYQRILADSQQTLDTCKACNRPLEGRNQGTFVIPEFGFAVDTGRPGKPGEEQPERTYTTRTYYSGEAKEEDVIKVDLKGTSLIATPASDGQLAVVNHAGYQGFKICHRCGYAILGSESTPREHDAPWRTKCRGRLSRLFLGYEFTTDILQVRFEEYSDARMGFWLSLLYALLEGASEAFDIDRQDLDGCLYPFAGNPATPALILFDNVPGGAGHVRRIAQHERALTSALEASREKMQSCECGGEQGNTSCYGCLRNYQNQFCHDELDRGMILSFLKGLVE